MSALLEWLHSRFRNDGEAVTERRHRKRSKVLVFEDWILQMEKKLKKLRQKCLFGNEKTEEHKGHKCKYGDKTYLLKPASYPGIVFEVLSESGKPLSAAPPKSSGRRGKFETRWTGGRAYTVEKRTLYLTPTNFPCVSYLDLDEFLVDVSKFCPQIAKVSELETWRNAHDHPLDVGCPDHYARNIRGFVDDFLTVYRSDVREMIQTEYEEGSWVSLWHAWDPGRFRRFLDFQLERSRLEDDFSLTSSSLISLLRRSCTDSRFVVSCFKTIALGCESRDFLSKLPNKYVETFLKHSRNVSEASDERLGGHEIWLVEENLVEQAFVKGDVKRLQMLFQYRCPSAFVPDCIPLYFEEDQTRDIYWPREKPPDGGEDFTSYNSTEYITFCLLFVFSFFKMAPSTVRRDHLTRCVTMLWRSIPTPFVPVDDIRDWIRVQELSAREVQEWDANMTLLPGDFRLDRYSPRSLMHLCRCAVRERHSTPDDVNLLPLPSDIKSYLKLNK